MEKNKSIILLKEVWGGNKNASSILLYSLVFLVVAILFNYSPIELIIFLCIESFLLILFYCIIVAVFNKFVISDIKSRIRVSVNWGSRLSRLKGVLVFFCFAVFLQGIFFTVMLGLTFLLISMFNRSFFVDFSFLYSFGFIVLISVYLATNLLDVFKATTMAQGKYIQVQYDYLLSKIGVLAIYFILFVMFSMLVLPWLYFVLKWANIESGIVFVVILTLSKLFMDLSTSNKYLFKKNV